MPTEQTGETQLQSNNIAEQPKTLGDANPKKSKKKLIAIIASITIVAIAIIVALIFILAPRYELSIESAYNTEEESVDGVKKVSAEVDVECHLVKEDGFIKCGKFEVNGKYGSNRDVSLSTTDGEISGQEDGKFLLSSDYVSIKDVAIRDEFINGPISQVYHIEMTDNDSQKAVIKYKLKVNTILSESDLNIINTENPDTDMIKTSLEKVDTITEVCIVNEDNDPNDKLGKQGSYYIKVVFKDARLSAPEMVMDKTTMTARAPRDVCEMGAGVGGTVEVYKELKEAETRKSELDAMLGGFFDSGPSEIIGQKAVIRVSSDLKASEQNALLESMKEALTK